ncbi:hypothetical protein FQA39_LY01951 [Lamprigera yunnana]|nr:hypothetical protein FQA39_LY01951 [Lamprigera yunnana]
MSYRDKHKNNLSGTRSNQTTQMGLELNILLEREACDRDQHTHPTKFISSLHKERVDEPIQRKQQKDAAIAARKETKTTKRKHQESSSSEEDEDEVEYVSRDDDGSGEEDAKCLIYKRGLNEPIGSFLTSRKPQNLETALIFVKDELDIRYFQYNNKQSHFNYENRLNNNDQSKQNSNYDFTNNNKPHFDSNCRHTFRPNQNYRPNQFNNYNKSQRRNNNYSRPQFNNNQNNNYNQTV